MAKIDDPNAEKPVVQQGIQSGAAPKKIVLDTDNTNDITETLKSIFKTLETFTTQVEKGLGEVETKFGLSNDSQVDETLNTSVKVSREDRQEEAKLNKMAG